MKNSKKKNAIKKENFPYPTVTFKKLTFQNWSLNGHFRYFRHEFSLIMHENTLKKQ